MNEPDPRCEKTFFCVEANFNETQYIWEKLAHQQGVDWRQDTGILETIGTLTVEGEELPVSLSLMWNWVRGKLICFYDATSRVVDHKMIEDYLDSHIIKDKTWDGSRKTITDASNYHHMWHAIQGSQVIWNVVKIGEPAVSFENLTMLSQALFDRGIRQAKDPKIGNIFWGPNDKCEFECSLTNREILELDQKLQKGE